MSIRELLAIIGRLSHSLPLTNKYDTPHRQTSRAWYKHQKEHLLGFIGDYLGAGAYNRKGSRDSAAYWYNHFQCWTGLLWLVEALSESPEVLEQAVSAALLEKHTASQAAAFRRVVPWTRVFDLLEAQAAQKPSLFGWATKRKAPNNRG